MAKNMYVLVVCLLAFVELPAVGSPTKKTGDLPLSQHFHSYFYSVEKEGTDAVCVHVHKTGYSLGKYSELFLPYKDECAKHKEILEDDDSVIVRIGERLAFLIPEYCKAEYDELHLKADAALYVLRGNDLPLEIKCPEPYRNAPLLIGFAKANSDKDSWYDRYLFCLERNRSLNLDTGKEDPLFFPYRSMCIPRTAYEQQGGVEPPAVAHWLTLWNVWEKQCKQEDEYLRLLALQPLNTIRRLGSGTNLVHYSSCSPYIGKTCAVATDGKGSARVPIAIAEISKVTGGVAMTIYDDRGRVRLYRFFSPKYAESRPGDQCYGFPGDGTMDFWCSRSIGEEYRAFSYLDEKVSAVPDDERLHKKLREIDEKFRRLFGFGGFGELTLEEIVKGLE